MAKKPTKKEQELMEQERKRLELLNLQRETKTKLMTNINRLNQTLRNRQLIMKSVSAYIKAGQGNYKDIDEMADKVQNLNSDLLDIVEFKLNRELIQNE